ncbi:MAG: ferritin-like domain-containing protein [Chloroflexi bacterium]|nr:ferritin-like domain-containing protein [Chloroflexota bacterium]
MTISKDDVIAMLNEDMRGEHMAIVQYLLHAYAMGEGEIPAEIEAIARDEMRHFDWLADAIVELGGTPTLERAPVKRTDDHAANMRLDVTAEDDAIALYEQHIAAIDDPKLKRLLERIVSDEKAHREDFVKFADEVAALAAETPPEAQAASPDPVALDVLDKGVRHEYTVILQYLWHSFVTPHCDISRELEMQAINEMQHLGWLAEEMAGMGGSVEIERTAVNQSTDTAAMLAADIRAEREVTEVYSEQLNKIADEGLKALIARIRDHEVYHDAVFSDLLQSLQKAGEKAPSPTKGFTVGSLKE